MAVSLSDKDCIKLCSRGHQAPKMSFIADCFSIEYSNILCVFIVGSHLWGSCNKKSDWDLVIVTNDLKRTSAVNAHKGNIDAWIVPIDEYFTFISNHLIQALLTLWIPESLVMKKKTDFNPARKFCYSPQSMKAGIEKLYERDTRVAGKHYSKGDHVGGIKIVKHLIRQLGLCEQIIESGCICDYTHFEEYEYQNILTSPWKEIQELLDTKKELVIGKI